MIISWIYNNKTALQEHFYSYTGTFSAVLLEKDRLIFVYFCIFLNSQLQEVRLSSQFRCLESCPSIGNFTEQFNSCPECICQCFYTHGFRIFGFSVQFFAQSSIPSRVDRYSHEKSVTSIRFSVGFFFHSGELMLRLKYYLDHTHFEADDSDSCITPCRYSRRTDESQFKKAFFADF